MRKLRDRQRSRCVLASASTQTPPHRHSRLRVQRRRCIFAVNGIYQK